MLSTDNDSQGTVEKLESTTWGLLGGVATTGAVLMRRRGCCQQRRDPARRSG